MNTFSPSTYTSVFNCFLTTPLLICFVAAAVFPRGLGMLLEEILEGEEDWPRSSLGGFWGKVDYDRTTSI